MYREMYRKRRNLRFLLPRGGRRMSSSAFLSQRTFSDTIFYRNKLWYKFATNCSSNGRFENVVQSAHRCSFNTAIVV